MRNELIPEDAQPPRRSPRDSSATRSRRMRASSSAKHVDAQTRAAFSERQTPLLSSNNGGSPEAPLFRPPPHEPASCDRLAFKLSPSHSPPSADPMTQTLESDVHDIRRNLRALLHRVQVREERNRVALEWKVVALVLDRIFFIMYLSAIIVSLATLFPKTY